MAAGDITAAVVMAAVKVAVKVAVKAAVKVVVDLALAVQTWAPAAASVLPAAWNLHIKSHVRPADIMHGCHIYLHHPPLMLTHTRVHDCGESRCGSFFFPLPNPNPNQQ